MRLFLLLLLPLVGCQYAPLGYEDSIPDLRDAQTNVELSVFGSMSVSLVQGSSVGCESEFDLEGYADDEALERCPGCDAAWTVYWSVDRNDCIDEPGGGMSFGIGGLDTFPADEADWILPLLTDDWEADAFLSLDWNPGNSNATWGPRMGLWEVEDPTLDFDVEYQGSSFWDYGGEDWDSIWEIRIGLIE